MKTINFLISLALLISFKICFAWSVSITNPNGSSTCPTRLKYYGQGGQFAVTFDLNGISGTYEYWVNLKQGGGSPFFTTSTTSTSSSGSKTVNINYSNVCMNNIIEVQVYVRNQSNYGDNNSSSGFYIMYTDYSYTSCPSNNNKGLINGTSTLINSNFLTGTMYHGWPCGIASQGVKFKKYKIEWTVSGSFSSSTISINRPLSLGYSAEMPNYQNPWAMVDNITSSSAHFYTFVYELQTLTGSNLGYWPCAPSDAAIIYTVTQNQPPIISYFTQIPPIIYPGTTGYITCHLSQGNCCNVSYSWGYEDKPSFMSVSFSGNTATIQNNYTPSLDEIDKMIGSFKLTCAVSNDYGTSPLKVYLPIYSTNGGGCPWVFVQTDDSSVFSEENNILHRSEFPGNEDEDITDVYKIISEPYISGSGDITVKILESGRKYSYFDQFKLMFVDHPDSTELAVDENNGIVMFTPANVLSTDTANFNDTADITDLIQYPFTLEGEALDGDTLDHAYVHYPSNLFYNCGLLTNMDYDRVVPINKTQAASVTFYTNQGNDTKSFAMRELSHNIFVQPNIASLLGYNVYNVNLTYQRHFNVRYISLVEYSVVSSPGEVDLVSAELSDAGDITQFIEEIDQEYGEMDSLSTINLTFNTSQLQRLEDGYKRTYFLSTVGRYIGSNPNDSADNYSLAVFNKSDKNANRPMDYKLHNNYPNPFNPITQIRFDMPSKGFVKLGIYNILGQLVKLLINEYKDAGSYEVVFDATNFASGVYFYKIETGSFTDSKKMILIK